MCQRCQKSFDKRIEETLQDIHRKIKRYKMSDSLLALNRSSKTSGYGIRLNTYKAGKVA